MSALSELKRRQKIVNDLRGAASLAEADVMKRRTVRALTLEAGKDFIQVTTNYTGLYPQNRIHIPYNNIDEFCAKLKELAELGPSNEGEKNDG